MHYEYKTSGTCSRSISFDVENGKVANVQFVGGCNGNLKGIGALVEGMNIDDVIARVEGVTCGMKSTSCPDQLAQALKAAKIGYVHNAHSPQRFSAVDFFQISVIHRLRSRWIGFFLFAGESACSIGSSRTHGSSIHPT